jgi:hypothetical protein
MKFQINDIVKIIIPSLIIGMPPFWKRGPIINIDDKDRHLVQTGEWEQWLCLEEDMILAYRNKNGQTKAEET